MITYWLRVVVLAAVLALLAACGGGTAASPTVAPTSPVATMLMVEPAKTQPTALAATSAPAEAAPTAASAPTSPVATVLMVEPAKTQPAAVAPTAASIPATQGQVVLQLAPGAGARQVGMADGGPRSFRIGGDGTIRVLDNANKRILVFGQGGERGRVIPIAEAQDPSDFIINTKAEVYVLDKGGAQVLHYGRDNALLERLPLNKDVASAADGVMTTSDQDVYLVQNNETYWSLVHQGKLIAPDTQALTMHSGTISPRSPRVFQTIANAGNAPDVRVSTAVGQQLTQLTADVPEQARFFNVDREMNLYFSENVGDQDMQIWRVLTDGTRAGRVHLSMSTCDSTSWRSFYVDQAGAAWTMCVTAQGGATFTRYDLRDAAGNVLPAAATTPADVAWKPGSKADLVKG